MFALFALFFFFFFFLFQNILTRSDKEGWQKESVFGCTKPQ